MLDSRSKKLVSLLFAVVILLSCVVVYQFVEPQEVKGEEHQVLGLSVSPSGSTFKLGVNQSKTFAASALNGSAPFSFSWEINPSASLTLKVNEETLQLTDKLVVEGEALTLCFPEATVEFVTVSLSGTDVNGLAGEAESFVVADPYTSSGYYFDGSMAVFSYKVVSDGLGWYRVFRGSDGAALTAYDGTNSTTVVETLLGDMTSGALFLDEVAFDLDLLSSIPEDVRVICSYNAEYWEYINDADSSGSPYTVSVGSGVNNGYYLAQDGEGRICYASTDASSLIQNVIDASASGGIINLPTAQIPFTSTVNVTKPLVIQGQIGSYGVDTYGTVLLLASGVQWAFYISTGGSSNFGAVLKNFAIRGDNTNNGIWLDNCYDVILSHLQITCRLGIGIKISNLSYYNNIQDSCQIWATKGIVIGDEEDSTGSNFNKIDSSVISGDNVANSINVQIVYGSHTIIQRSNLGAASIGVNSIVGSWTKITSCLIESSVANSYGVKIEGSGSNEVLNVCLSAVTTGISVASNDNTFRDLTFPDVATPVIDTGTNNQFYGKGFEMSGVINAIDGTVITTTLLGATTAASFSIYGNQYIDSDSYFLTPSVASLNATTVTIRFFKSVNGQPIAVDAGKNVFYMLRYNP